MQTPVRVNRMDREFRSHFIASTTQNLIPFTKQFIRFEFSTQLAAARKYSKMHLNQCTRHRCLMDTLQFALHQFNWMAEVKRNRKRQVNKYYTIVENAEKNGKRRRATTSKRMIQTEVKGKKSPE